MHLIIWSTKWWLFCPGSDELRSLQFTSSADSNLPICQSQYYLCWWPSITSGLFQYPEKLLIIRSDVMTSQYPIICFIVRFCKASTPTIGWLNAIPLKLGRQCRLDALPISEQSVSNTLIFINIVLVPSKLCKELGMRCLMRYWMTPWKPQD